ncbi:type I-F CRISPR-associated protein Csy1 [Methylocaldum sp.]|jgi:hypothetical protein|uniref:type I-F CRISPR-associated protein Csy1 n=1 Tax=Methylocaldum sp. TaxID=1969727 RepID=UPI00321FEFF6
MTDVSKTSKESGKEDWKPFTSSDYRDVAQKLVHFSAKGVNSNASACGIRLDSGAGLRLPYVSVRCLMTRGRTIDTDYTKNTGNTATVVKQIHKLASGEHDQDTREAQSHLAAIAHALSTGYQEGTDSVSPRLRQLLLPRGVDYVAISPLPSGGLSREINRRVQAHLEALKNAEQSEREPEVRSGFPRWSLSRLGIGGANPQNVGALVRDMQTALLFDAPKENPEIRAAYAIHYKGIRLGLPRQSMAAWRDWREKAKAENGGRIPTDMAHRDAECALIKAIGRAVLNQGAKALRRLGERRDDLPGTGLLSDQLQDGVIRGLIDPAERGKDWPRQFGARVARAIGAYSFGEKEGVIALDGGSLDTIARWIEEEAR